MTCREFTQELPEYLDGTLESGRQEAVRHHLKGCADCGRALHHAQMTTRSMQQMCDRATATVSVTPELAKRILSAVRAKQEEQTAGPSWVRWLTVAPFRLIGSAVALGALTLLVAAVWLPRTKSPAAKASPGAGSVHYSVYVPFHNDRQEGLIHAEFSYPNPPLAPTP